MILVAGTGDDPAAPAASNAARLARAPAVAESELVFADWRIEPESVNCLMLEPWQVRHGDEVRAMPNSRYDSLEAMSRVGRQQAAAQGLDPSEWTFFMRVARDPNMQARSSLWPPEGAEYERTTTFRAEYIPNDLMLVFEDLGDPVAIDINGERHHGAPEPCFVWDRANRQVALRGLVRLGENTVILRTRMPGYRSLPPGSHGMEPVALRGSFAVRAGALAAPEPEMDPRATTARADEAPAAAEPTRWRSWEEFGWPSYSGAMTYHARFHLPVELAGRNLLLECADVRETMEVSVNGRPVGLRLWPPYRLDISAAAQAGDNTLAITVTNTLSNLFTRPLSSGLLAPVRIAVMPDDVPAGVPLVSV